MVMMSRPIFSSLRHKDGGDGNRREREREETPRTSEAVAVDPALLGDRSLESASVSQRERGSSSTILLLQKLVISLADARTAAAAAMAAAAVGVCRKSMEVPRLLQQCRLRSSRAQGPSNGSQTCCCFITAARMGFAMLQTHDDTLLFLQLGGVEEEAPAVPLDYTSVTMRAARKPVRQRQQPKTTHEIARDELLGGDKKQEAGKQLALKQ